MAPTRDLFFYYTTVFRSRIGLANLLVDITPLGQQSDRALRRRIRIELERKTALDLGEPSSQHVCDYLAEKRLITTGGIGAGRYGGLQLSRSRDGRWTSEEGRLTAYQVDIWMADPAVRSTIGVPTPDNANEVVEFGYQLAVIDKTRHSWTSNAYLLRALASLGAQSDPLTANPFRIGAEGIAIGRTLLERDGLALLEVLRFAADRVQLRRDDVAQVLPELLEAAVAQAQAHGFPADSIRTAREQVRKLPRPGGGATAGPGVLEHRSSARVEWLTDLGLLSKEGLGRNEFAYKVPSDASLMVEIIEGCLTPLENWANVAVLEAWRRLAHWTELRSHLAVDSRRVALALAYRSLRRHIGPSPLMDVALVSAMLCSQYSSKDFVDEVMEVVRGTPGASLSGGRHSRAPESIYMSDEVVAVLLQEAL